MSATERDLRIAREAGERAARLGKPVSACPPYDNTARGCAMAEAWQMAHDDERARIERVHQAAVAA